MTRLPRQETATVRRAPEALPGIRALGGARLLLAAWPALGTVAFWGRSKGSPPSQPPAPESATSPPPVSMEELEQLEHLAWKVDTGEADAEQFVEAKLGLLTKPTPEDLIGPISHLGLPTDELSSLERLHASGHLTDSEFELLRRRVILKI